MVKKVYVGNLPYSTDDNELKEAFSGCGEIVSSRVVFDKVTKKSRGYGFVEFKTPEQASKAISTMDKTDFAGRSLTVNEAIENNRADRAPNSGGWDRRDRR